MAPNIPVVIEVGDVDILFMPRDQREVCCKNFKISLLTDKTLAHDIMSNCCPDQFTIYEASNDQCL
jgi:urocanate hydratase